MEKNTRPFSCLARSNPKVSFLGSRTNDYRTVRVDTNMLDALFAVSNGNLVWKLFTDIGHPRACLLHSPANRVSR